MNHGEFGIILVLISFMLINALSSRPFRLFSCLSSFAFYDLRHTVFAPETDYPFKANFLSENPFRLTIENVRDGVHLRRIIGLIFSVFLSVYNRRIWHAFEIRWPM